MENCAELSKLIGKPLPLLVVLTIPSCSLHDGCPFMAMAVSTTASFMIPSSVAEAGEKQDIHGMTAVLDTITPAVADD